MQYGIAFTPNNAASLFVSDTVVSNNGTGTAGGGIFIQPTGSGAVSASIVRVNAVENVVGIRADGTNSTGTISVSVLDSAASANAAAGMAVFTPSDAKITMEINHSVSANNGIGLNANGAGAILRIGYSTVTGNATGITISNGAKMRSLGTNLIDDNTIPGPALTVTPPS